MSLFKTLEELSGDEAKSFVIANKSELIAIKRKAIKYTDVLSFDTAYINAKDGSVKALATDATNSPDVCRVKVVANTAMYCDSQMDVLLPDNAKKSIKERKGMIPHLHDHIHQIGAEIGDTVDIYYQTMSLSELGIAKQGTAQALILVSDVLKSYNEQTFNKYKSGKIKQHSIGLQYVKIGLAVNDPESVAEYELWQKYAPQVINQDLINEKGFFWVVPEIKLLEISAVLFGSNPITPTLEVKSDTEDEPSEDTNRQPGNDFDIGKAIKTAKFI